MIATRARWRVGSKSSNSKQELEGVDGAGDSGYAWVGGTTCDRDGAVACCSDVDVGGVGTTKGRPEAARALTTASQPFSRVLILSLNSWFSFSLANSFCRSCEICSCADTDTPMPDRSCLFSSSSSATRRSRWPNWAFRLSREFWAAIRLRWARASLRSSGVISERERLRGGHSDEEEGEGEAG